MLPACRTASEGFAIPTFDLTPPDVEGKQSFCEEQILKCPLTVFGLCRLL